MVCARKLTWSSILAVRSECSFGDWHIKIYLSTPAADDTYVPGGISASQRVKTAHQVIDEVLTVFEKSSDEARR